LQDEGYTVGEVTRLIKRRIKLIGWTFVLLSSASIVVAYSLETLYRSSGSIVIESPEVSDQFLPGTYQAPDREQRISRINDEVMTRDNLVKIVEKHDLYRDKRGTGGPESVVTAKAVARDIVSLFLEGNKARRQDAYVETSAALTREAEDIRVTVAELESQLADFKTENPGALPEDRNYNRQVVERKSRDLTELDREIRSLQERKTLLQSQLAQTNPWVTTIGPDGQPLPATSDRLQQLEAEYLRLIGIYNPNHPDVVRVHREIESLTGGTANPAFRQALEAEYTSKQIALADAERQYGPNHPDVLGLKRSIDALKRQIAAMP
jgi:uncharacterized protein involved in exopolysaccharide biosynthesis